MSPIVKKEELSQIQVSPDQMERSFPRLCSELRFAKDQAHCDWLMDSIADQLRLGETWYAMKTTHGAALRFMILGYITQRAEKIQSHRAYIIPLLAKNDKGEMNPQILVVPKAYAKSILRGQCESS